jgi:hypothetical protein
MTTIISTEILGEGRLEGRQLGAEEVSHTIDRYRKRIETAANSFRGQVLNSGQSQIDIVFPSLSEAGLAAIEIQRRITDLPPISGVRLTARIGIHEADSEEEALNIASQLMKFALPEQILCGREILLDQVHSIGVRVRDLHQIKLGDDTDFQVAELLWHDDEVPVSLTATSVLSLADIRDLSGMEPAPAPIGNNPQAHVIAPLPEETSDSFLPPEADTNAPPRLCVRYQNKSFLLDEKTPFVTLGREYSNDVIINDNRVSRQHARIERKGHLYYLVDTSTNGTFVLMSGKLEHFLRKESVNLEKNGVLSLGSSIRQDNHTKKIEFEFL